MKEKTKKYIVKCHVKKELFDNFKRILVHENLTQQKALTKLVHGYVLDNMSIVAKVKAQEEEQKKREQFGACYDYSKYDYYYGEEYEDYLNGNNDDYY